MQLWKSKKLWTLLMCLVCGLAVLAPDTAYARGFRGGGGFSRGRSSWGGSSRRSSSSSRSSWGGSRSKSISPAGRRMAGGDRALAAKAKTNGTSFNSRASAVKHFKANSSGKYTSKYASKPTARPGHIPQKFQRDGKSYNISFNAGYGGYGYMYGGRWIMYSMMADAVMMETMMARRSYYYGRRGGSCMGTLVIIGLIVGAVYIVHSGRRSGAF